jgi:hypothetical protein
MSPARAIPNSSPLPLSALLSQTLIAFTLELDNEFERQMLEAGYRGIGLSLAVWSNLFRFIGEEGITVGDLTTLASGPSHHMLPCLERWRFLTFTPPESEPPLRTKSHRRIPGLTVRDGYGSGRDIRRNWIVRLTPKGRQAKAVWPSLFDEIEGRWRTRFGANDVHNLRGPLEKIVNGLDIELPDGLPALSVPFERDEFPPRVVRDDGRIPLPALLSKALLAFALEFNRESEAPLSIAANVLRVAADEGVRVSDLPRLTGGSPEVSAIGWRLKYYVTIDASTKGRGKLVRPNALGLRVRYAYPGLLDRIESRWEHRFGAQTIHDLRASLRVLFTRTSEGRHSMSAAVQPPPNVRRSAAAPGFLDLVPAERKRTREMAAQTAAFVNDPNGTLPHYPVWDMNRGFGP